MAEICSYCEEKYPCSCVCPNCGAKDEYFNGECPICHYSAEGGNTDVDLIIDTDTIPIPSWIKNCRLNGNVVEVEVDEYYGENQQYGIIRVKNGNDDSMYVDIEVVQEAYEAVVEPIVIASVPSWVKGCRLNGNVLEVEVEESTDINQKSGNIILRSGDLECSVEVVQKAYDVKDSIKATPNTVMFKANGEPKSSTGNKVELKTTGLGIADDGTGLIEIKGFDGCVQDAIIEYVPEEKYGELFITVGENKEIDGDNRPIERSGNIRLKFGDSSLVIVAKQEAADSIITESEEVKFGEYGGVKQVKLSTTGVGNENGEIRYDLLDKDGNQTSSIISNVSSINIVNGIISISMNQNTTSNDNESIIRLTWGTSTTDLRVFQHRKCEIFVDEDIIYLPANSNRDNPKSLDLELYGEGVLSVSNSTNFVHTSIDGEILNISADENRLFQELVGYIFVSYSSIDIPEGGTKPTAQITVIQRAAYSIRPTLNDILSEAKGSSWEVFFNTTGGDGTDKISWDIEGIDDDDNGNWVACVSEEDKRLKINIDANPHIRDRRAKITVYYGTSNCVINIKQDRADYIECTPESIVFDHIGGEKVVQFSVNIDESNADKHVYVESIPGWLSYEFDQAAKRMYLTSEPNNGNAVRSYDIIVKYGNTQCIVAVQQLAKTIIDDQEVDYNKKILSLGESFETIWNNICEKFARKDDFSIPTRTVFVFKSCDFKPGKPFGGSWDYQTNELVYPLSDVNDDDYFDGNHWGPIDGLEKPIYMSVKTFAADMSTETEIETDWSTPILISGTDGTQGANGISTEFIFNRTASIDTKPEYPDYSIDSPDYQKSGFLSNSFKEGGWSKQPYGPDKDNQVVWVGSRIIDDGKWSAFSDPVLWSKYSEDGNSVEYIYINGSAAEPELSYNIDSEEYQKDGYAPENWKNDLSLVDNEHQFIWISSRKKVDGKWSNFSEPTVFSSISYSVKYKYLVTDKNWNEVKEVSINDWSDNIDIETYELGEYCVWGRIAVWDTYNDKVVGSDNPDTWDGWTGPILISPAPKKAYPNFELKLYAVKTIKNGELIGPIHPTFRSESSNYDDIMQIINDYGSFDVQDNGLTSWKLYPDNYGFDSKEEAKPWYVVNGVVNGVTRGIEWGAIVRYTGQDGIAMPGQYIEYRYAMTTSYLLSPSDWEDSLFDDDDQPIWNPEQVWTVENPITKHADTLEEAERLGGAIDDIIQVNNKGYYKVTNNGLEECDVYIWQTWAIKNPDPDSTLEKPGAGTFILGWQTPIQLTGRGSEGKPGDSYIQLYIDGNINGPKSGWGGSNENTSSVETLLSKGWSKTPIQILNSSEYPYNWMIQARVQSNYNDTEVLTNGTWSDPVRMSGLNVLDQPGAITIYPILSSYSDIVMCSADGSATTTDLNITTTMRLYKGSEDIKLGKMWVGDMTDSSSIDIPGVIYELSSDSSNKYVDLIINGITGESPDRINIPINVTPENEPNNVYTQVFTISKLYGGGNAAVEAELGTDNIMVIADEEGRVLGSSLPVKTSIKLFIKTPYSRVEMTDGFTINHSSKFICTYDDGLLSITYDDLNEFNSLFDEGGVANLTLNISVTKDDIEYTCSPQIRLIKARQTSIYNLRTNSSIIKKTADEQLLPSDVYINIDRKSGVGDVVNVPFNELSKHNLRVVYVIGSDIALFPETGVLAIKSIENSLALNPNLEIRLIHIKDSNGVDIPLNSNEYVDIIHLSVVDDGKPSRNYKLISNIDIVQCKSDGTPIVTDPIKVTLLETTGDKGQIYNGTLKPADIKVTYSIDNSNDIEYVLDTDIDVNSFNSYIVFKVFNSKNVLLDRHQINKSIAEKGNDGLMIYPAGNYSANTKYTNDGKNAPYVFDLDTKKYYILIKPMSWVGSEQGYIPISEDANSNDPNWQLFETFNPIYSSVGVNGMSFVGSAIFFNNFVFSKYGKDNKGNKTEDYRNFCSIDTHNPYSQYNSFYPNICFDFNTGSFWLGGERIHYDQSTDRLSITGIDLSLENIDGLADQLDSMVNSWQDAESISRVALSKSEEAVNIANSSDAKVFDISEKLNDIDETIAGVNGNGGLIQKVDEFENELSKFSELLKYITVDSNGLVLKYGNNGLKINNTSIYYSINNQEWINLIQ